MTIQGDPGTQHEGEGTTSRPSDPGISVLVVGAAGMLGRKLAASLARRATLGTRPIRSLTLSDVTEPGKPSEARVDDIACVGVDLVEPHAAERLVEGRPDVIFHLAAIVSGEAEADFAKGYAINLDASRGLLEAIRRANETRTYRPRIVYASSIAVFGAPFPATIDDEFLTAPSTSYGTQKAIVELLLNDFSRREIVDAVSIRLPTICVRPGAPNAAASGFFSNIIREPLRGRAARLPVDPSVRHWFASPRSAVGFLERAAVIDTTVLGTRRALNMPGLSATVQEQLDALRRVAGDDAVELVEHDPDPAIQRIVSSWPQELDAGRATALGFAAEQTFDDIIRVHLEDESGSTGAPDERRG